MTPRTATSRPARSTGSGSSSAAPAPVRVRLALTTRCAMVASVVRKARAISAVVNPPTSLRVSVVWASWVSDGWQQMNISRSTSSCT